MPSTTVLIVEDEAIVAADLAARMAGLGYQVIGTTAKGEDAVAIASNRRPDLVMMDIRLAGAMDGIEAADRIRTECDVPVIFLTALSDRATVRRAAAAGPFGYILKPFSEPDLETHIAMALYKHGAERQLRIANELLQEARDRLAEANRDLRQANETLEARVAGRTSDLRQRTQQLQALAGRLINVEEGERRRLANLLHDELQQLLVGARLQLEGLLGRHPRPPIREDAQKAVDLLVSALSLSRNLTAELSPPVLQRAEFAPALAWLARWCREKYHLDVRVRSTGTIDIAPEEVRVALFRSVSELLFNVAKHAGVNAAVVVAGLTSDGRVRVSVSDKGAGFDPGSTRAKEGNPGGFGLFRLRERLESLGGQVEIRSTPGRGSRCVLTAPMDTLGTGGSVLPSPATLPALSHESQNEPRRLRVMLADSHPAVRESVAGIIRIEADLELVGQASRVPEALDMIRRLRPDVVVIDADMAVSAGMDTTEMVEANVPGTRVITLSMFDDEADLDAMRRPGAVPCVSKSRVASSLADAIRRNGSRS